MLPSEHIVVIEEHETTKTLFTQLDALDAAINTFFNRAENALTQVYRTQEATRDLDQIESLAQALEDKLLDTGFYSLTRRPTETGDLVDVHEMAGRLNDRVRLAFETRADLKKYVHAAAQL